MRRIAVDGNNNADAKFPWRPGPKDFVDEAHWGIPRGVSGGIPQEDPPVGSSGGLRGIPRDPPGDPLCNRFGSESSLTHHSSRLLYGVPSTRTAPRVFFRF
jgi:hypothetical protein